MNPRAMPAGIISLAGITRPDRSRARKYLVSAIRPFHRIQNNAIHQRYEPPYHPSKTQTTLSSSNENNNNKLARTRSVGLTDTSPNYTRRGYLRPSYTKHQSLLHSKLYLECDHKHKMLSL